MRYLLLVSFMIILSSLYLHAQSKFRPSEEDWKWADEKLKKMSLDEKVGQLVHIGINARFLPQDSWEFQQLKRQVVENKIGGIIFFVGPVYETVHLMNRMQEFADIPLLISADFETGVGMRLEDTTVFPWNMAIAATGNPEFARKQGEIIARESKALGVHQVFAPVVDVNNNPENPVINVRSYGEDPKEVAKFAIAFIEGLQNGGVIATAKHFPGHGNTNIDSHRGLPVIKVSRERLDEYELYPFREVIKAGVASVMISHISLPELDSEKIAPLEDRYKAAYTEEEVIVEDAKVPATLSKKIVTDILKKEMGFDGLIVTDAMDMSGLTIYFNQDEAAVRAIEAGADIILKPANTNEAIRGIREAILSGRLSEERINESVRKQLAWKHHLGLTKQKTVPLDAIDRIVSNQSSRQLAMEIAENAITLVKNEDKLLPLAKDKKIFFLAITNQDMPEFVGEEFVKVLRRKSFANLRLGLINDRTTQEGVQKIAEEIARSDIVLAGFFVRVRSGARNSIEMPERGHKLLETLIAEKKKIIGISFGNPYLLRGFPSLGTYIVAYGDMPSLQNATARALIGEIDFKGKLPITIMPEFPKGTGIRLKESQNIQSEK
jgi:beta-N-acetylhexosaminidase